MKEKKKQEKGVTRNTRKYIIQIRDPLVTLLYMANMQFIFLRKKTFIDIPSVKTVRRISF